MVVTEKMQKRNSTIKTFVLIFIVLYLGFGLALFAFQKNFVYFPSNQDFASCEGFEGSEKISINGTRAYYKKNSETLIVFYHGNAGSACDRAYLKEKFEKVGLSYIFVEYAGYSGDTVKPSKKLLIRDAENIADFTKKQGPSRIFVAGESLGASLAVYHSSLAKIDKLLLISPFYRISDIARKNYGIYPVSLMMTEDYDSSGWMKKTKAESVEIVHGGKDEIIPIEQAKKLFIEAGVQNKTFIEIAGAHHNDIYNFAETFSNIHKFLSE